MAALMNKAHHSQIVTIDKSPTALSPRCFAAITGTTLRPAAVRAMCAATVWRNASRMAAPCPRLRRAQQAATAATTARPPIRP